MQEYDPRHVVGYADPGVKHADLDSQFETLLEADNGLEIVQNILRSHRMEQNTININEFYRFEPLFRLNGMEEIGEERLVELTEEYFEKICPFDPVAVVNDEGKTMYLLPPIFNRAETINMAGQMGTDIAQAFINACQLPDEVSGVKRTKYLNYYKQLLDIAQNKARQDHVRQMSAEMTDHLMNQVKQEAEERMATNGEPSEIQPLQPQSNLNQKVNKSSSVNMKEILPFGADDEISPL